MRHLLLIIYMVCVATTVGAQECRTRVDDIRSLRVVAYDDAVLPPVVERRGGWSVAIEFDEMSHEYHRYRYHIDLCNADWTVNDELFESDYLSGLNDQPLEDYEKSFNTTQLYTHYRLRLPNRETRLRLSANYRVSIYDEDDDEEPVATAEFCLYTSRMSIMAEATGNTDTDFNGAHQQLAMNIGYGTVPVTDYRRELHTVVVQNRRADQRRADLTPSYQKGNGLEYTHHRDLIFTAGNEYHKFELLDVRKPGLGIDHVRWLDPYYYVSLFDDTPPSSYVYDEDQNGASVIRNEDNADNATTCEYVWVTFTLKAPEQQEPVYVCGTWTNGALDPAALMTYNPEAAQYEASLYLKQGYYNYQYRTPTRCLDGDFYETENEYLILVYHRAPTGRYDELVGYRRLLTARL